MNTTQPPARRDLNSLLERVDAAQSQLAAYLPAGVDVAHFMAIARRAVAENPQLADCSTGSVLRALSNCASSGLPLDGQFSSLIVRKSKHGPPTATWDPTYRGMISLAMSSGFVTDVQSFAVTEHDEFSVEQGTEPKIRHVPALLKGGRIVAAYAWARLRSGRLVIEVMGRADLDTIKRLSPAGERGPWGSWESQMARKSAVRRLLKKLRAAPFRSVLEAVPDPFAMQAELAGPAPTNTAIDGPAREVALPEDEHAVECRALERLHDAQGEAELAAAWAQTTAEYMQMRLEAPVSVRNAFESLRDRQTDPTEDPWLRDYENAPDIGAR